MKEDHRRVPVILRRRVAVHGGRKRGSGERILCEGDSDLLT